MNEFTQEEIEKLISLVSQNTVLYDSRLYDYNNVQLKENLWNEIAMTLEKTSDSCKRQWKMIRDGYVRYKRTNNLSSVNSSAKKTRNWMTYKMLSFYDAVPQGTRKRRPFKNNGSMKNKLNDKHEVTGMQQYEDESALETDEYHLSDSDNYHHISANSTSQTEDSQHNMAVPISHMYSYRQDDSLDSLQEDASHQNFLGSKKSPDDVGSFSIYIKDVLKMLPPVLQIKAKQEVFTVLSKYQMMAVKQQDISAASVNILRNNTVDIKFEVQDSN